MHSLLQHSHIPPALAFLLLQVENSAFRLNIDPGETLLRFTSSVEGTKKALFLWNKASNEQREAMASQTGQSEKWSLNKRVSLEDALGPETTFEGEPMPAGMHDT